MLEQFDQRVSQLIQHQLRDYDDQIAQLTARVEELERRVRNIIQPATVLEIHPDGQRIRLQYGRNETPFLKWFAPRAGAISEYRCPSLGEQCVLVNYGGGDNATQAWALCGIWSDQYPLPDNRPHMHVIDWGGGMRLELNTQAGTLDWWVPSKTTFHTPLLHGTEHVRDFKRRMEDDRQLYNVHKHGKTPPPTPQK